MLGVRSFKPGVSAFNAKFSRFTIVNTTTTLLLLLSLGLLTIRFFSSRALERTVTDAPWVSAPPTLEGEATRYEITYNQSALPFPRIERDEDCGPSQTASNVVYVCSFDKPAVLVFEGYIPLQLYPLTDSTVVIAGYNSKRKILIRSP